MTGAYLALRLWGRRRWGSALVATALGVLIVAVPTDLIDTPAFGRAVPPTWWSWPALLVSATLGGLLAATYVRESGGGRGAGEEVPDPGDDRRSRLWGGAGGILTFFAVGCPVCNKLALLALGASGALTYFEPVQPLLSLLAVLMLGWALVRRLRTQGSCPVPGAVAGAG